MFLNFVPLPFRHHAISVIRNQLSRFENEINWDSFSLSSICGWNKWTIPMEKKDEKSRNDAAIEVDNKSPRAMPFILCNVFSERFCSAGVSGEFEDKKLKSDSSLCLWNFSNLGAIFQRETSSWPELVYVGLPCTRVLVVHFHDCRCNSCRQFSGSF